MYVCLYMYCCIRTYMYVCIYMLVCMYICVYAYMYMYVCIIHIYVRGELSGGNVLLNCPGRDANCPGGIVQGEEGNVHFPPSKGCKATLLKLPYILLLQPGCISLRRALYNIQCQQS